MTSPADSSAAQDAAAIPRENEIQVVVLPPAGRGQ
jgi:hypothetical protein